jgi:hypothetical protein
MFNAYLFSHSYASRLSVATVFLILLAGQACAAPPQASAGFPPTMPLKDRIDIMNAAGYEITPNGQNVFVYCGETKTANQPAVGAVDLTGDGKAEYIILGERKCPGETTIPIKSDIIMRRPDGVWQNILSVQGAPKPGEGATDGWRNLNVVNGSRITPYVHDAQSEQYSSISTLNARKNLVLAVSPSRAAPGTLPTAAWKAPYEMGSIAPGDLAAILTAVGYKRTGGKWTGCGGSSDVMLFEDTGLGDYGPVTDLNGDGQPEVMVYDSSSECYGSAGMQFNIVTPTPAGWKLIFAGGEGMPLVQQSKGPSGWRDVAAGGPGFCHGLYRYNGKSYVYLKSIEETKGACAQ